MRDPVRIPLRAHVLESIEGFTTVGPSSPAGIALIRSRAQAARHAGDRAKDRAIEAMSGPGITLATLGLFTTLALAVAALT